MSQFNKIATSRPNGDGASRLANRITGRLLSKPLFVHVYVLALNYEDMKSLPPPPIELEIREVTEKDDGEVEALAGFRFYGQSKSEVLQYLEAGQRCWVAKHEDQVICCSWRATGHYRDYYFKRRFDLADNEEYLLGGWTSPAFRGMGIFPHVIAAAWHERSKSHPDWRAITFIRPNNRASLQTAHKMGLSVVGRVGFIEVFGIRFHFLLGRDVLPKTSNRVFFRILGEKSA